MLALVASPGGRVLTMCVEFDPPHAYSIFHLLLPCQLLFVNNLPDLTEQKLNIQKTPLSAPCSKPFNDLFVFPIVSLHWCLPSRYFSV